LAAGIRRVKGVKKRGIRLGNWLTAEQGNALWQAPDRQRLKGKRDRALVALLLACGLRRHEAVALTLDHLQQREEHWAIVDLVRKGGHIRTVPVPDWAANLCSAVPRIGRRIGADPVSPGARFGANDRTLPRLQAADSISRQ
jgi:integrase